MIDHISVGVSDLERSARFYEATLAALGLTRLVTQLNSGVDYAGKWKAKPYRFLVRNSEYVSKI